MNHHAVPADKKVQDYKSHATCNPGVGCFAFTVPAKEASMLATSAQSYAQTQPDPHHLAEGAGAMEAAPGTEDQ